MRLTLGFYLAITVAAFMSACGSAQTTSNTNRSRADSSPSARPVVGTPLTENSVYSAEIQTEPNEIKAGEEATLLLSVKDKRGATVKDLQVMNEKLMHLLIVSDDLAQFAHIHAEQPDANGIFRLSYTFPNGGTYKLYADYQPPNSNPVVDVFDFSVSGSQRPKEPIVSDTESKKSREGLTVTLKPVAPMVAGRDVTLELFVTDASGGPVTDLEPYLGAMAHFVVISADTTKFLHVHAAEGDSTEMKMTNGENMKVESATRAGAKPTVRAVTNFPVGGVYKLWAQMQRGGKVITIPFVFSVAEGNKNTAQNYAPATNITVSKNGFEPSEIEVKKGKPVKIVFTRIDEQNCASEIVFPQLKITRKLPLGERVVVEITTSEAGEIAFSCGMGMMKGKVLAQ